MKLLVTGGCGFLGSHFIRAWLRRHPDDTITNIDCLTYAGSLENLEEVLNHPGHRHVRADVADSAGLESAWPDPCDIVVHFAAETHVDRSLEDSSAFVRTNVLGTQHLLSLAARTNVAVVIMSSDEVYGPAPRGTIFGSGEALRPTSPYAASKAAADLMALAYRRTFGTDVTIVRSVNVYGPKQYPEKLIPLFVTRALAGETMPLYGHGRQRRCWLYVDDFVGGLMAIVSDSDRRRERPVWHLGSSEEVENRRIAEEICQLCGAQRGLITPVPDRPGHDQRYALDSSQTSQVFKWKAQTVLAEGLRVTVEWIKANGEWCRQRSGWTPSFLRES